MSGEAGMDALDFFRLRYDDVHAMFDKLLGELAEAEVRRRAHPGVNTPAWLLWHVARIEDVGVNRFVVDGAQVLDDEGWPARLGVDRRDVGTGMTDAEVDELSTRIDLTGLREYWRSIARRTHAVVAGLDAAQVTAVVPADRVKRVSFGEGAVSERVPWLAEFWAGGRSAAWVLSQTALLHPYGHCYEARVAAGLLGHRSP